MKKWNIFLAALVTFFSCTNEIDPVKVVQPVDDGYSEVTFAIQVPGHKKPTVYAATAKDENKITELDVLAFAKNGSFNDTLAYRISIDEDAIKDAGGSTNGNSKSVTLKLKRSESDLKLVFIANAKSVLDGAAIAGGVSLNDAMGKLVYACDGKWTTSPMRGIPMWGQTDGYVSVQNPVVSDSVDITLLRSVVKVDVGVDVYGDPAIGFGSRFKLNHVYVYNMKDSGFVVPNLEDLGLVNNKVTSPNIPSTASAIPSALEYEVADTTLFNEIYLPESSKESSDHTCLVIGGTYDGGAETFYRIDFVNDNDVKLDLLRNHRFLVNIINVARDGFATKEEAFAAKSSHIEYSLGVFNEDINSIVYNGQYGLGVSDSQIVLGWNSSTGNSMIVATDYPGGFVASTQDSWITITSSPTGAMNGNVVFSVARNNDESLFRTGKITITAGSLVQDIEIKQSLGANSVIVAPSGTAQLPALFANADGITRVGNGMSLQAEVLWQDATGVVASASVSGSGKEAVINVIAGSTSGNAVVAIKNGGTILWSWHVWVTTYNPEHNSSQNSYNGTVFMNQNLGALVSTPNTTGALGLLYQWGRKDPFPGAASTTADSQKSIITGSGSATSIVNEKVTVDANFDNAVKNPMTFYYSKEYPWFSWYGLEAVNNSLWVDAEGNKTAYDPCPQGWRVPVSPDVWAGVSLQSWNNGAVLSSVGYYPANGSIDFTNGLFIPAGTEAYYWTATPSGSRAMAMNLTSSGLSIQSTPFRASGCSVRCVKE